MDLAAVTARKILEMQDLEAKYWIERVCGIPISLCARKILIPGNLEAKS